jgi:hypothetical protein
VFSRSGEFRANLNACGDWSAGTDEGGNSPVEAAAEAQAENALYYSAATKRQTPLSVADLPEAVTPTATHGPWGLAESQAEAREDDGAEGTQDRTSLG